jgi:hypothetical protein
MSWDMVLANATRHGQPADDAISKETLEKVFAESNPWEIKKIFEVYTIADLDNDGKFSFQEYFKYSTFEKFTKYDHDT